VSYRGQSKTPDGRNRWHVCGLRSGTVSRGRHSPLACGMGLSGSVLWFHHYPEPMVAQAQPWIADGAFDRNRQTRSTHLGQTVLRGDASILSRLAVLDAPRCRPFLLVTDAGVAPGRGGGSSAGFVVPLFPDISAKPSPVTRRSSPNRARANGDIHWAVSLCAPSDVRRRNPLYGRHSLLNGAMIWVIHGVDPKSSS